MDKIVAMTVNVEGIGPELRRAPESALVGGLGYGRYAYKVGLPRLLDVFQQQKIKATFFWPSSEALRVPLLVKRCLDEGHEIACYGRAFEDLAALNEVREREILQDAHHTLTKVAGVTPVGFRSPTSVSTKTYKILSELGYRYDSSNIDDDAPYSLNNDLNLGPDLPPRAAARNLVELPWSFDLRDSSHMARVLTPSPSGMDQNRTESRMIDALEGLLAVTGGEGWAVISLNPRQDKGLARAARVPVIEHLVKRARELGAEFKLLRDVAKNVARPHGRVVWNGKERA
jgi:peptidoglycan/xylan/chitin deacetylase (PgdA/CDA1 family)